MKKMILAAIAVLAFSAPSFAADACAGGKCQSGTPVANAAHAITHPIQAVRGLHPLRKVAKVVTAPVRFVRGSRGCGK